jgi:A/G-specific adenine glycosylase
MSIDKPEKITSFRKRLMHWHTNHNQRQMPWKGEKDPYKIWLSEIILQQTRVEQGRAYYERFVSSYPTVQHLAMAKDDAVFKLWEGLGYYSRCKNLLATARMINTEYDGVFPSVYSDILQLKGIGPYTAAAIASFAFNLPHAVVDGNVYRVLARFFGIETPSDSTEGKKLFSALAAECLDNKQPALYNQAIMDFGATVCTPANPLCSSCPLQKDCLAYEKNMVAILPIKTKQLIKKDRWFTYFIIEAAGNILVRKRIEKDIWQNLHEFLLEETNENKNYSTKTVKQLLKQHLTVDVELISMSEVFMQKLTHQTIYARFIRVAAKTAFIPPAHYFLQPEKALTDLAFPKTITQFLQQAAVQQAFF